MGGFGGGGGGRGTGGDGSGPPFVFWVFVASMVGLFWLLTTGPYVFKSRLVRRSLEELAVDDKLWNPDRIEKHVRHVFMEVQLSWARRNLGPAHEHVSQRLHDDLTLRLEKMKERKRRNIMNEVRFKHADAVGLIASPDPSDDRIWVWIDASLVDYIIDEDTGIVMDGCAEGPRRLREVWSFVRGSEGWVVDEINQKPSALGVLFLRRAVAARAGA